MKYTLIAACSAVLTLASSQASTLIMTEFGTADGFVTGGTANVVLGNNAVTFSGGQQQQGILGAAYNNGPAAYLFINGGGGFNGAASTGDTGSILFGGSGASSVSFHAADLANGPATTFTSFDLLGNQLQQFSTSVSNLNGNAGDAGEILTFTAANNVYIGSIVANLPGPATPVNPPYAASIDTFSATVVGVPEPSSALLATLAMSVSLLRRRR